MNPSIITPFLPSIMTSVYIQQDRTLFLLQFTTQSSLCTVASAHLKKGRKQADEWGGKIKHLQSKLLSTTVTVFALHIIQ